MGDCIIPEAHVPGQLAVSLYKSEFAEIIPAKQFNNNCFSKSCYMYNELIFLEAYLEIMSDLPTEMAKAKRRNIVALMSHTLLILNNCLSMQSDRMIAEDYTIEEMNARFKYSSDVLIQNVLWR